MNWQPAPTCVNIIRTRNSSSPLRAHFLQKCVHSFLPNSPHQIIGTNPGHFSDNFAQEPVSGLSTFF